MARRLPIRTGNDWFACAWTVLYRDFRPRIATDSARGGQRRNQIRMVARQRVDPWMLNGAGHGDLILTATLERDLNDRGPRTFVRDAIFEVAGLNDRPSRVFGRSTLHGNPSQTRNA